MSHDRLCHVCENTYNQVKQTPLVLTCPNCGHTYRTYDGDNIKFHAQKYRKDKRHHRDKSEFDDLGEVTPQFHNARKAICEKRLEHLKPILESSFSCLDIGAGAGTFAKSLLPFVSSVSCIELDRHLLKECQRLGLTTMTGDFLSIDIPQQFDLVTAWHVLEHVENAKMFVSKMKRLSKKHVVIEVPHSRRIKQKYDGHLHYFSEKSFRELLTKCGLEITSMTQGIQTPSFLAKCITSA